MVRIAYEASVCLRNLGYRDLSRPAVKLAVSASRDLDDPAWRGAADFVYTLSLPMEAASVSRIVGERSLVALQAAAADTNARQMLGQVHLSAALSSANRRQSYHMSLGRALAHSGKRDRPCSAASSRPGR